MSGLAIRAEGLGKRYLLGEHHSFGSLRESLITRLRSLGRKKRDPESSTIWALRDVSFDVAQGEAIGIIGRNGAGKSTLLKVLSRITEPTTGRAEIRGRVGSLLEVGTGFHPELTGRENIFLNGAILGMRRFEIRQRFDQIVSFAEVEKFIDTPVKRYSSGMYLRLAFAVAAHLDPEILLVDEVLAVGDSVFQKKCLGKMGEVARQGRTVVFVSHNLSAISTLCQRALWIDQGRVREDGRSETVVTDYLSQGQMLDNETSAIPAHFHAHDPLGIRFENIEILNGSGESTHQLFFGDSLRIRIDMTVARRFEAVRLAVAILRLDGTLVATLHQSDDPRLDLLAVVPGTYSADISCPIRLMPGAYTIGLLVKQDPGYWGSGEPSVDFVEHAHVFHVGQIAEDGSGPLPSGAVLFEPSTWIIKQTPR